ncbi:MAG: carbamoyltransferase HypF [Campylobacterota bacterium]|nr:carbamoyltransferase HypF [Campylobacterota bacterium]
MNSYHIIIKGLVQGVGFRPFIYNLAIGMNLKGEVHNESSGVHIKLNGSKKTIENFIESVKNDKPILSQIDSIEVFKTDEEKNYDDFTISSSTKSSKVTVTMPHDSCMCEDCKDELYDKNNRRYNYPFINCTNCGPRYTLIDKLPYDRIDTSMEKFQMCKECEKEYTDPTNRRYHAQVTSCKNCGPVLELRGKSEELRVSGDKIIDKSVEFIKDGYILAVKGIGGYHLVCDATNSKAVEKLRERKNRPHKPYAVMVRDISSAKNIALLDEWEKELLESKERPIVLLKKLQATNYKLPSNIAPFIDKIGLFLPYTPLHQMLMDRLDSPIIATSANRSGDPICTSSEDIDEICDIWDYCVDHNRDILNGCDDSVVTSINSEKLILRAARGYAPVTFSFDTKVKENILSLGANQKSTVAFAYEDKAVVSPYLGDLDSIKSIENYEKNIENFKNIYSFKEEEVVSDKHKGYESFKYAKRNYTNHQEVQHHYAHILSVMGEKNIYEKVIGVAFDGTGLGDDKVNGEARDGALGYGTLWGGEFLYCDRKSYKRIAFIKPFKLIGGSISVKEPRRCALSLLFDIYGEEILGMDHPVVEQFSKSELNILYTSWSKGLNAPMCSSVGRVFDAVASIADIIHLITYEGQSGSMMESIYDEKIKECYPFSTIGGVINIDQMIRQMIEETNKSVIVSKFFNTIVNIIEEISKDFDTPIVLSGGVFQNVTLLALIVDKIPNVIYPNKLPCNDAAISFGQMIWAKENNIV